MFRIRYLSLLFLFTGPVFGDILEERNASGSNIFVPTAFPLNPAANNNGLTLVQVQQTKRDDKINFTANAGSNNSAAVEEKIARKDLMLGGQYPLGGASFALQYSEHRREVSVDNANTDDQNHELFVNRDYRTSFGVDFTPELRGAFTFHYTAVQSDLTGNFSITDQDRTSYRGNMSGYGLGLHYQFPTVGLGVFSHPPMRGKATVEGEQKIISEPGLYGLQFDFAATPFVHVSFNVTKWSYKHDERDDPATSPSDQRNILLRGLDINQYLRKTMAYGVATEVALTPMIFVKGQYLSQNGVFLFDPDHLPGDDKELESKVRTSQLRLGAAIRNKDFVAELGFLLNKAKESSIKAQTEFGNVGDYKAGATGINLMIGAAF